MKIKSIYCYEVTVRNLANDDIEYFGEMLESNEVNEIRKIYDEPWHEIQTKLLEYNLIERSASFLLLRDCL